MHAGKVRGRDHAGIGVFQTIEGDRQGLIRRALRYLHEVGNLSPHPELNTDSTGGRRANIDQDLGRAPQVVTNTQVGHTKILRFLKVHTYELSSRQWVEPNAQDVAVNLVEASWVRRGAGW